MTIKQNLFGAILIALLGIAATALAQGAPQTPAPKDQATPAPKNQQQPTAPSDHTDKRDCPDFVRGSKLSVTQIDQGVVVTLTTPTEASVQSLRTMAHNAAGYVESNERKGTKAPAKQGSAEGQLPPLDITVTDIDGGAKVSVKAQNKGDVGAVREQAKKIEEMWKTDACVNGQQIPT